MVWHFKIPYLSLAPKTKKADLLFIRQSGLFVSLIFESFLPHNHFFHDKKLSPILR